MEPVPLQWKRGVLTAGGPGKSGVQFFSNSLPKRHWAGEWWCHQAPEGRGQPEKAGSEFTREEAGGRREGLALHPPSPIAGLGSPRKSGAASGDMGAQRPPWANSGQVLGPEPGRTLPDGEM